MMDGKQFEPGIGPPLEIESKRNVVEFETVVASCAFAPSSNRPRRCGHFLCLRLKHAIPFSIFGDQEYTILRAEQDRFEVRVLTFVNRKVIGSGFEVS